MVEKNCPDYEKKLFFYWFGFEDRFEGFCEDYGLIFTRSRDGTIIQDLLVKTYRVHKLRDGE